uniref:C-type lectin domain-containing protein n=1 Tax=Salarias fasciatus TaxID=181472 RepID=A0A672G6M1_SALFA
MYGYISSLIPFFLYVPASLIYFLRIIKRSAPEARPQYHLISLSMTWREAQQFCRVKHSDLATVANMDDKSRLENALDAAYAWIGLRRGDATRWMWSDGSGVAAFTKWAHGEPNDHGSEWCTQMSQNTNWNDLNYGTKKFIHYSDKGTWADSVALCRSSHTDLASIQTDAENSEIAKLIKSWTGYIWLPKKVWIGLFKDSWSWSDGSGTSFRYWLKGSSSSGNCLSWQQDTHALCRSSHTDLASIQTDAENSEIAKLIKSWTGYIWLPKKVWIGLFEDSWSWSDGSGTSFRYWLKGSSSSGNCVSASAKQQGGWIQSPCEQKSRFICQGGGLTTGHVH